MDEVKDEPLFCERVAGIDIGKAKIMVTIGYPATGDGPAATGDPRVHCCPQGPAGAGGLAALLGGDPGRDGGHRGLLETGVFSAGAGGVRLRPLSRIPGQGPARRAEDGQAGLCVAGEDHRAGLPAGSLSRRKHPPAAHHTRYRRHLVQAQTAEKARCEKLLEDAHLKLSSVISDIHGVSGRAMLTPMIAGQRDPKVLAQMARTRIRGKIPGAGTSTRLLVLHRAARLHPEDDARQHRLPPGPDPGTEHQDRRAVLAAARQIAQLDAIPGFGIITAQDIIAESGSPGAIPAPGPPRNRACPLPRHTARASR